MPGDARTAFGVRDTVPCELAVKLALGLVGESAGDPAAARRYLELVLTVNPRAYASAAFGLARTRLEAADPAAAIAAMTAVPDTSSRHEAAQVAAVRVPVAARPGRSPVTPDDLRQAGGRLARLKLGAIVMELLTAEILLAALDCVAAGSPAGGQHLGCEFSGRALRFGLERSYRAQARLAAGQRRRIGLVDQASRVRPGTWS
jgi:serine/threonine-protein kinase PknG